VLLTRSPLVYPRRGLTARLACVKHAAIVRPEPGSNSPLKSCGPRTSARDQDRSIPARVGTHWCRLTKGTVDRSVGITPYSSADGALLSFVDFWHAVEFSRIKRTPLRSLPALPRGNLPKFTRLEERGQTDAFSFRIRTPHCDLGVPARAGPPRLEGVVGAPRGRPPGLVGLASRRSLATKRTLRSPAAKRKSVMRWPRSHLRLRRSEA
jgi:hypothetical protein